MSELTYLDRLNSPKFDFAYNQRGGRMIKFKPIQALTSHFESFWSIVTLYSLLIVSSTFSTYLFFYGGKLSHAHIRLQWLLALESLNIRKPYVEAEDDSSCNDWKQRPSPSKSIRKVVSFISIEDGGPDGFLLDIRICQIENVMT